MKKWVFALIAILSVGALSSCSLFGPDDKEFSGSGITITLNSTFAETDSVLAPLFVTSLKHIFTGLRESKTEAVSVGINSLDDYIDFVLANAGYSGYTTYESENGDYMYAYYSATVEEVDYGYMLICMEGENHYYLMNFGCYSDDLDDSKEQYIEWADTIIVEWSLN